MGQSRNRAALAAPRETWPGVARRSWGGATPQRAAKLRRLRKLLGNLPADEVAVLQDEVDVNLNPKIGSMWVRRGQQGEVPTPGTNEKRHPAGSLNLRTGDVVLTEGWPHESRNMAMFLRHLADLRYGFRCYRRIHVICDNAIFHVSRAVQAYFRQWGQRTGVHFRPTYSPEPNLIERIWWHLREEIARDHGCRTLDELLDLTFQTAGTPATLRGRG